jgi:D-alanyl-lipoteichoic acid acyltransferase DltB (MBOAT superfamily)
VLRDLVIDPHLSIGLAAAFVFCFATPVFSFLRRERWLLALSVAAAALWYGRAFAGFLLVSAIAYAMACWVGRQSDPGRRWSWACIGMFLVGAVFTGGRVWDWDRPLVTQGSVSIIVYSLETWAVLRLLTLLWEVGSGSLAAPQLGRYVIWTCLPFTLGGPLLRFSQMPAVISPDRKLWRSSSWWLEGGGAAARLILGIALTAWQQMIFSGWPQAHLWEKAIVTFVTGPIGYYLTAGGYFQLMEVLGRPAGFNLPPSFNFPIGRENISAFWANWNMTATFVFRDFFLHSRWGRHTYNVYFNTLVLFTLMGLWHMPNAYWILWGFLHGVLFCIFLFWRKHRNEAGRIPLAGTRIADVTSRVLTYAAVCMCWYLPSKILQKLGGVLG